MNRRRAGLRYQRKSRSRPCRGRGTSRIPGENQDGRSGYDNKTARNGRTARAEVFRQSCEGLKSPEGSLESATATGATGDSSGVTRLIGLGHAEHGTAATAAAAAADSRSEDGDGQNEERQTLHDDVLVEREEIQELSRGGSVY